MSSVNPVSVIMPTFNQAHFISRAIISMKQQTHSHWELIIINDGSTDNTQEIVSQYLENDRIRYIENDKNIGLGASLNIGLAAAQYNLIAYLPSDDIYYKDHLLSLSDLLVSQPAAVLTYSGVRHHYNREASGIIEGYKMQLVQVMHRKNSHLWITRDELVTDDLDRMFWSKFSEHDNIVGSGSVSCEWVDHPHQRHKIIQEPLGGINPYKLYYGTHQPLRFHSTAGNLIDEISYYRKLQPKDNHNVDASDSLKILLVGELAYNPERILAFEEQGHKLFGLWMKNPYWYNYVGPFPFGNVEDIPYDNWEERVAEIKPDIIYALLNWQAVPFAHEILMKNPSVPFVWHFKEGPFICLEKGTWNQLIDLYTKSDGQIYTSPEMRDWFHQFLSSKSDTLVLDGDLPKRDWFTNDRSPLLSVTDGEIHTVVPGRPIGLHPHTVEELGKHKIHLHFYGDFTHGQWKEWIKKTMTIAPNYLHIHSNCSQDNWVKEFSQYDAGWLHFFKSSNNGELMKANWDDLNIPARMATLAAAGLPMLQHDNTGHIVATQALVKQHGLGIIFTSIEELASQMSDKDVMTQMRERVWQKRMMFTFDEHVDELINFFKQIIDRKHALRYSGILPFKMALSDTTAAAHHEQAVG
jgi:glycosyltransferase involved in cell wall biosynthesis